MSGERTVRVDLGARSYEVVIGSGLLADAGRRVAPFAPGRKAAVVVDETVAALHLPALLDGLKSGGIESHAIVLPAGEGQKSFLGLELLSDRLLALGLERRDLVIAFGGGVIGDLAGLTAGLLKRGLDFVQIPTTLLAQVDSSVGGKTAINATAGKNLVGLFHQPRLVLADQDVLATLPERERRAGYAEIVKIGLINDAPFFDWCEWEGARVIAGGEAGAFATAHAIEIAVDAKAKIVATDEREGGVRALLNLGHTFAHAIEAEAGMDGSILHGEAVGCGLGLAFGFSAQLGLCDAAVAERVAAHLRAVGFETELSRLPGAPFAAERLVDAIMHDKKNEGGALTFILARGIGEAFVARDVAPEHVHSFLRERL
jgi:3-dehydroquinate synthase